MNEIIPNAVVEKLSNYLLELPEGEHQIPFDDIEAAIGFQLPELANDDLWWERFMILSNSDILFNRFSVYNSSLFVDIYKQLPDYRSLARSKEVFLERWDLPDQEDNYHLLLTRILNECSDSFYTISKDITFLRLFCSFHGKSVPKLPEDRTRLISRLVAECETAVELAFLLQTLFWILKLTSDFEGMRNLKRDILRVLEITSNPPFFLETNIIKVEVNLFKSGSEFLDTDLVNYSLHWLSKYPEAKRLFAKALEEYSKDNISDVDARTIYDDLRTSLEKLIQLILGNSRTLENNKNEIEVWLKVKGAHVQVIKIFNFILHAYIIFMNDVKHASKYNSNDLEFMVYQTAIMMRMLLEKERS